MLLFAQTVIGASWIVLFGYFVLGWLRARHGRVETGRSVNPGSLIGMALEIGSLALIPYFRVTDPGLPAALYAAAMVLAMSSAAFGIVAGVHLGKQLRIQAVVTDEHKLITGGPYSVVRHPIYASMLGLLVASVASFCEPKVLALTLPVFIVGTEIRVRTEDNLLAQHFGAAFEQYRSRVKAYIPGLR